VRFGKKESGPVKYDYQDAFRIEKTLLTADELSIKCAKSAYVSSRLDALTNESVAT
jgi:hypothetical protein